MQNKRSTTTISRNVKRLFRNKLAVFGLILVLVFVLSAICAPLLSPYIPEKIDLDNLLQTPTAQHILGTDKLGRDVFARLLYGGRISILVGVVGAFGSALIGITLGCIGGYFGGLLDKILLRISETFSIFPQLMLVLILVTFMGQGLLNLLIIFAFTGWMGIYRLIRARFFSIREETFVTVLRAFRIPKHSIMFKHMLPNTMGPVIVGITLSVAGYILQESGLSFLGLGVPASIPTWGNIINAAQSLDVIMNYWWLWVPPGLAISLFVLGINFFGDGLRDALDPKQTKKR